MSKLKRAVGLLRGGCPRCGGFVREPEPHTGETLKCLTCGWRRHKAALSLERRKLPYYRKRTVDLPYLGSPSPSLRRLLTLPVSVYLVGGYKTVVLGKCPYCGGRAESGSIGERRGGKPADLRCESGHVIRLDVSSEGEYSGWL